MARKVYDCVVETSTTTGTGDFTLAGAVVGFQRFDDVCAVNDIVYYLIEAIDGNGDRTGEWETGSGTYTATDTLERTTYHDGSGYPTATNFSAGTKRVSLSLVANQVLFRGTLAYKSSNQTAANFTTATALSFDSTQYNAGAYSGGSPTRLTVPADVVLVKLKGHVRVSSHTASNYVALYIYKNGSLSYVGQAGTIGFSNQTTGEIHVETPVLQVTTGDYFELFLEVGVDTSITVEGTRTWFAMEIVE